MEGKATNNPNEKVKKPSFGAVVADHKAEFRKIVWPQKDEMVKKVGTVIVVSLIVGAIVFCYDTVFTGAVNAAMSLFGLI